MIVHVYNEYYNSNDISAVQYDKKKCQWMAAVITRVSETVSQYDWIPVQEGIAKILLAEIDNRKNTQ